MCLFVGMICMFLDTLLCFAFEDAIKPPIGEIRWGSTEVKLGGKPPILQIAFRTKKVLLRLGSESILR